jgi:hypothetical protein
MINPLGLLGWVVVLVALVAPRAHAQSDGRFALGVNITAPARTDSNVRGEIQPGVLWRSRVHADVFVLTVGAVYSIF